MESAAKAILKRIQKRGRGHCFTLQTFVDLGSARAVENALSRLAAKDVIRRLDRGLYDYPRIHPVIGQLSPKPEDVAKAIAEKNGASFQPSGAYAANALGLSDQIPAKVVFLTDGPSRRIRIGRQEITLKKVAPRNMAGAGTTSGLVIQALRHIGRERLDESHISRLASICSSAEKDRLKKNKFGAPAWARAVIDQIVEARDV